MNDAVPTTSLTETAYRTLRGLILSCRLMPGQKIVISSLSASMNVSAGAVREALSRLSAEGLVIAESQKGFHAAPISSEDLADLTATRIEIETACLSRAIERGDIEWETGIVAAYHRLSRTPERDPVDNDRLNDEWSTHHRAFHFSLVSACASPWRLRLRDLLYDQSERYRRLSAPSSSRKARDLLSEHRAIMDATLARDAASCMPPHCPASATHAIHCRALGCG